jgi:hypothetical protein
VAAVDHAGRVRLMAWQFLVQVVKRLRGAPIVEAPL